MLREVHKLVISLVGEYTKREERVWEVVMFPIGIECRVVNQSGDKK